MRRSALASTLTAVALGIAAMAPSAAAPVAVTVDAAANSSTGGTPLDTGIDLVAGNRLVSTVSPTDCWSAGGGPRVSNANGLNGSSPPPCQPTNDFGLHTQDGETFAFGSLIGRIGSGDWFFLGTGFDQVVAASGRLFMVYWDQNSGDNSGSVTATVDVNPDVVAVPQPPTLALALAALGLAVASRRARRT